MSVNRLGIALLVIHSFIVIGGIFDHSMAQRILYVLYFPNFNSTFMVVLSTMILLKIIMTRYLQWIYIGLCFGAIVGEPNTEVRSLTGYGLELHGIVIHVGMSREAAYKEIEKLGKPESIECYPYWIGQRVTYDTLSTPQYHLNLSSKSGVVQRIEINSTKPGESLCEKY